MQLLSSLDPLEHSASLSLGGVLGSRGVAWGILGYGASLFHGKSGLWAHPSVVPLCVRLGSGHPAAGPVTGAARGVMVSS